PLFQLTEAGLVVQDPAKTDSPYVWIQTDKIPVGLDWRPPKECNIHVSLSSAKEPKALLTGWVRYGCDGEHWSTWYELERSGKGDEYRCDLRLPLVAQDKYVRLKDEFRKANPRKSADDDDLVCQWIAGKYPEFFEQEIPFLGYLQFRFERFF